MVEEPKKKIKTIDYNYYKINNLSHKESESYIIRDLFLIFQGINGKVIKYK